MVYDKPTHTCSGASTSNWEIRVTGHDAATMLYLKTYGWIHTYSNALLHQHHVCHTVKSKPHHILTPRYTNIWWMDTTKLEDWLSDIKTAADILKESLAYLAEAKSLPTPWFMRHLKLEKAGTTFGIYIIWNCVIWTYIATHYVLWDPTVGQWDTGSLCTLYQNGS